MRDSSFEGETVDLGPFLHRMRDLGAEVDTITEPNLAEQFKEKAVKTVVIDQVAGGYEVQVTLNWRASGTPLRVTTQRTKQPKTWSNLERLAQHLRNYPNLPPLIVKMLPKEEKNGGDNKRSRQHE